MPLEEEATKDGGCHNEEDTSPKPRGSRFACVRIPRRKLVIDLDPSDKSHDRPDGIDEFRCGVEVTCDHFRSLVDPRHAVSLCVGSCCHGEGKEQYHPNFLSVHCMFLYFKLLMNKFLFVGKAAGGFMLLSAAFSLVNCFTDNRTAVCRPPLFHLP